MSDILLHAAIQENQRLVNELMAAKDKVAKKEALQAAGVSPTITSECNMYSIEAFGYSGSSEDLCYYPRLGRSGYVIPRYYKPENLQPVQRMCAINDMWCKTFGQVTQPQQNGCFAFESATYGRCGGTGGMTIPTGVCRVRVQLWGPGGGSGGACCQGSGMPGPNGAYSVQEFNVTSGDTLCWCYACAYCCYGSPDSQPGGGNGYCTSLCYCDVATTANYSFWAWDAPAPTACRHNCMWCMAHNYNNCCNFQIGGNWYLSNGEDVNQHGGCNCSFGQFNACIRGVQSCGNWGFCIDGPSNGAFVPMMFDHYCGFGTSMSRGVMRDKVVSLYGHYAVWPGMYVSPSCCIGSGFDGSPSYIEQAPVVGFPESWWIDGSRRDYIAGIKVPPSRCCSANNCISSLYCHGTQKAPGIGGNAMWNMSPGYSCGEYGGGGAVCVSWDYYC